MGSRSSLLLLSAIILLLLIAAPFSLAQDSNLSGQQHARLGIAQVRGETRQIAVPMVVEPWASTQLAPDQAAPRTAKSVQFIGQFPGFREGKVRANRAILELLQHRDAQKGTKSSLHSPVAPPVAQAVNPSLTYFEGPSESDTRFIPPDSQIAVGPSHVVVAINSLLAIYDKSGTRIGGYQQLSTFFSSLEITGNVFDPRLIYDQADQRYILSAGEIDFTTLTNGHIMLAVSATDDPTQTWYKFAINSKGRDISNKEDTFPDFPGLGLSSSAAYVTTNQFALTTACLATDTEGCYFSDAQIRVIGLAGLLAGNPSLTITTFTNVQTADGFPGFAIQPALTYGSPGYEFLVAARFDNYTGTALDLFAIPTSGTLTLSTRDLTVPAYSIPPDAIQAGSSEVISTNDFRPLNAVWAGGSLFLGQNVQSSLVAARWYQIILPDLASASLAQAGDIQGDGEAYYPAVSLKSDGTLAVLFTTSSQYTFASAAFTGREAADPPGAMRSFAIYRAGTDRYAESSVENRWGDYSGISEDPDGNSVWGIAEYAGSPNPHFGTAIARISAPPALTFSPSVLNFGGVLVGRASDPLTVTVTNISENSTTLGSAATSGPNAGDFSIGNDACSGQTLAASQTCTFFVTFTPSTQSFEQASAGITYSGQQIAASATGYGYVAAVITPSSSALVFPETAVGTASAPMTVTFTNSGNIATGTPSFYFYGTYSQTNNCTVPLAPGSSCEVTVVFHPAAPGTAYGLLIFQNYGQQGASVSLSGIGVGVPTLLFCPSSVQFATQTVGTTSSAQSVIITNSGSKTLNVAEISTSGDFSQTNNCPGTLPQQSNCVVTVSFTPSASGSRTGVIQVSDNAPGSPHMLPLTGSGSTTPAAFLLDPADSISTREERRASSSSDSSASSGSGNGAQALARQPLAFERNTGQFDDGVRFVARRHGRSFAVTRDGITIALAEGDPAARHNTPPEDHAAHSRTTREAALVRMTLPGADPARPAVGTGELPGKTNYFFGSDPQNWTRDVPTYEKVSVHGIYPGIDLIYYGNQSRLEYDFVVAPGADPKSIRLKFEGQSGLRIEKHSGDLVLNTPAGEIRFHRPLVYQTDSRRDSLLSTDNRRTVTGRYILTASNEVSFRVGHHDPTRKLVIDPIISFSTYLAGTVNDAIKGLAIDSSGNIYVTGTTYSLDFPVTPGAFQRVCGSSTRRCVEPYLSSPFISKLSADGSTLIYSTFLGGGTTSSADNGSVANAIAVDSAGNAYVVGATTSRDFPVTSGAFQTQCKIGGISCESAFVTKLNASGSNLVYSTFLGGTPVFSGNPFYVTSGNTAKAIAVDAQGDAYVAGTTGATDFPTTSGAFEQTLPPPTSQGYGLSFVHGFLSKLNQAGTALLYSSYVGGSGSDAANAVTVDSSGNVYVAGTTQSFDFPTSPNAIESGPSGAADTFRSGFIVKFNSSWGVTYSSYYPSTGLNAVAADLSGSAYVAGTNFAVKFHPQGCALLYNVPLQGNSIQSTYVNSIATDSSGNAYLAGSFDYAFVGPYPVFHPFQSPTLGNAFVGELNSDGKPTFYSTLGGQLGGSNAGHDFANAIAVDAQGNIYIAGETESPDFPTTNALQPDCPGCADHGGGGTEGGFITKLGPGTPSGVLLTRSELTFAPVSTTSIYPGQIEAVGLLNDSSSPLNIASVILSGSDFTISTGYPVCSGTIAVGAGCAVFVVFKPTTSGAKSGTLTITDDGPGSPRVVRLNGTGGAPFTLSATPQFSTPIFGSTPSVSYLVTSSAISGLSPLPGGVYLTCGGYICSAAPSTIPINGQSILTVSPYAGVTSFTGGVTNITIVGNYSGLSASLPVSFSVEDFYLSLGSPSTVSARAGQSANYSMSLSPAGGFNFPVNLTCAGAPTRAFCSVSPSSIVLDGSNASPFTVTVTTTAPSGSDPLARRLPPPSLVPFGYPYLWLLAMLVLGLALVASHRKPYYARLFLAAVVATLCVLISCGGGGGGGSGGGGSRGTSGGTPSGTYTLTITGTYVSGQTTLTHDFQVTLNVN